MPYRFRPRNKPSEITPQPVYHGRRKAVASLLALPLANTLPVPSSAQAETAQLPATINDQHTLASHAYPELTPKKKALSHNNFYELGTHKEDPAYYHHLYKPTPWTLSIEGEAAAPRRFDLDDLRKLAPMEERVYRLRCVEAWSMIIPWIGYPLNRLLRAVDPTANAKYIEFTTFNPEDLFPEDANSSLPWPYTEGLRIDEAMHPLTLLTFGAYGETLATQNGAPVRLIIPWKYGFKSGKALVRIRLTESQPKTTWNLLQPKEYGFYANVNPEVNHPRWSQSKERVIDGSLFPKRQPTAMLNGFADEVGGLYTGMDLVKNF